MSTKIWYARRFPLEKLAEFMAWVRPKTLEVIATKMQEVMDAVTQEYIKEKLTGMEPLPDDAPVSVRKMREDHYRFYKAEKLIRHRHREKVMVPSTDLGGQEYMKEIMDDGRPFIDMDCGWNIFLHDGECFATAWGWTRYLDDFEFPEWAEDYCYWNNTDPLDGYEEGEKFEEWQARGAKWDEFLDGREFEKRLVLEVFNTEMGRAHVSLTELQRYMKRGLFARALGASLDDKKKKLEEQNEATIGEDQG